MVFAKQYLKTYQGLFLRAFKLLDLVLVAAVTAFVAGASILADSSQRSLLLFIVILVFILISDRTHLYRPWRGKRLRYELLLLAFVCGSTIALVYTLLLFAGLAVIDGTTLYAFMLWFLAQTGTICLTRLTLRPILKSLRRRGFNGRRIVFVGLSPQVRAFLDDLARHPEFGIEVAGYVDERGSARNNTDCDLPRLGSPEDLPRLCKEMSLDQVWFAYPVGAGSRTAMGIEELKYTSVAIRQILDSGQEPAKITGILGLPLIDIDVAMMDGFLGGMAKSVADCVAAAIILVALSPLLLFIAIGVKVSSPGPVLYRQTRVTWKNEPFEILKFRSMPVNAEFENGSSWASQNKRTTAFGEFIRATSLDELPQFFNVLKGEMSIIGPRPERPVYVEQFKDEIPNYMKKHRVKAGITGWAQVNGLRGDTDLHERIQHDLYYIKNWSPAFDLEIVFRTIFNGLFKKHS